MEIEGGTWNIYLMYAMHSISMSAFFGRPRHAKPARAGSGVDVKYSA